MKKAKIFLISLILISCAEKSKKINIKENSNIREEYFKNGTLKVKAKLENGVEHGTHLTFYENQSLAKSGIKIKGKMNGIWKYYNPSGDITSVKHFYNDSILYNLDIEDFKFVKKTIESHIEVEIPYKWKVVEGIKSKQVLLSIRKDCDKSKSFCPSLTVTYEPNIITNELEINSYLESSSKVLKSSFNDFKTIKERKYKYEGRVFYEKIYIGSVQNIKVGAITTWIFDKENIYIITGLALNEKNEPFLKQEGLFKEITNNIKLID